MSFFDGVLNPMDIIVVNQQFCRQLNEPYGLDYPEKLQEIVDEINSYNKLADEKEKAIQKACALLVGLVFSQPFKNGNKRTSVALSLILMRIHHHDLQGYKQEEKQKIFYELLENTMLKMEGDTTIRSDIEKFLGENIIKI
jgi:prophage maintenance system killer protein